MADYRKSPVCSSPSYWIALGVGVVGIGAAALQERRGSAARYSPLAAATRAAKAWARTDSDGAEGHRLLVDMVEAAREARASVGSQSTVLNAVRKGGGQSAVDAVAELL